LTIPGDFHPHIQRDFVATPLSGPHRARMVHKDLPHQPGRDAAFAGAGL
jgi:hypothetical protein